MMLLNDSDNMLLNVLTEYDVVDHLDDNVRNAYSNVYVKDRARIEDNLRNAIDALKRPVMSYKIVMSIADFRFSYERPVFPQESGKPALIEYLLSPIHPLHGTQHR